MKKSINYISFFLCIGSVLMLSSCEKDFAKINDDPNNPSTVPNSYYLTAAQRGIMDNTTDVWWGGQVGNQLAQYWSSNQYTAESRYQYRTAVTNNYFLLFYAGGMTDADFLGGGLLELNRIIDNCKSEPGLSSASGFPDNQIAVATTLRVWLLQNMTDLWGNIPYSEALAPEVTRAPKYDNQSDIYSGLLSEINNAISLINEGEAGPSGDLIYGGDMELWKKFANSLKMRLALRIVDRNASLAQTQFEAAVLSGAFDSNADNALFPYGEGPDANPIYYNFAVDRRNDYASSNVMIDILNPLSDPRLPCYFAKATANDSWTGEVYGLNEGNAAATPNSSISQRSSLVLSPSLPGIFLDYAQVEFMLAEAAARGWTVTGDAQSHYNAGIQASIEFWTELNGAVATQTEIDAYISQPEVDYTNALSGANFKEKIGKQKWIALYNQGIQGWTEWRRLDYPILADPADGFLEGSEIPKRLKYAVDEQTLNSGNYSAAIAAQGPDLQNTRVWWDVY